MLHDCITMHRAKNIKYAEFVGRILSNNNNNNNNSTNKNK